MALKPLKLAVAAVAPKSKGDTKVVPFAGVTITELIKIKKVVDEGKARLEALGDQIKEVGVAEIVAINCENPTNPVSSVKLNDANGSQAICSFTSKYSDINVDSFGETFAAINARRKAAREALVNENEYAQYIIDAELNAPAFYNKDGTFLIDVYAEVRKALDTVTAKLVASGKLAAGTVLYTEKERTCVKPIFHDVRWKLGVEDNTALLGTVKNTVSLKAVIA